MGANSKIEWCTDTWNPLHGCSKVSEGCRNCYAIGATRRLAECTPGPRFEGLVKDGNWTGVVRLDEKLLLQPIRWSRPRRIFVNSMSDLFHGDVSEEMIDEVASTMAMCHWHTFQVLTKRAERMRDYSIATSKIERWSQRYSNIFDALNATDGDGTATWPLPNVWLGVSVEDQKAAEERIPLLQQTPAAVRFLSVEPLIGPVDLGRGLLDGIHWVIVGGESGPKSRPMDLDWARSIRDQCVVAQVPFFFKQVGGVNKKAAGRLLDGVEWNEFPK